METIQFEALGTHWKIKIADDISGEKQEKLTEQIQLSVRQFEVRYSRFIGYSLVSEMARVAGTYTLPIESKDMLDLYARLYTLTHGKLTPLIGQVMEDAGYDSNYTLTPRKLTQPPKWDDVLVYQFPELTLKRPIQLDFGALGKGCLVDSVSQMLLGANICTYYIDAGGDILHRSANGEFLDIGLENPLNSEEAIGVVQLSNQSLCGSSGSKRKWENYHHLIDPDTLTSPTDILATWVIADSTLLADALATALFFVPAKQLSSEFRFEHCILFADFSLEQSAGMPVEIFVRG